MLSCITVILGAFLKRYEWCYPIEATCVWKLSLGMDRVIHVDDNAITDNVQEVANKTLPLFFRTYARANFQDNTNCNFIACKEVICFSKNITLLVGLITSIRNNKVFLTVQWNIKRYNNLRRDITILWTLVVWWQTTSWALYTIHMLPCKASSSPFQ